MSHMPPGGYPVPEGKPEFGPDGRKIIYDENGKPCKACNSLQNFRFAIPGMKMASKPASGASSGASSGAAGAAGVAGAATTVAAGPAYADDPIRDDCPPDSEQLGRSTWTFLHSVAATYPETASEQQQKDMKQFVTIFSKIYPCWFCAQDFQKYIKKNEPKVMTQEEFGRWLCDAHNAVNVKLGKPEFDCNLWKQRWKDGWEDGHCD